MRTSVGRCMLSVLLTLLCSTSIAEAQPVSEDSSSQRILPLPEGRLSDVQTQMQLLQKLRSLVAASEDTPEIDDKQLEQLQQALKKLQEQLPPGIKPPDLDSIPKEQLDQAMSNPAMQQQLKKLLEQFSKDGLLPKNEGDAEDSPLPPIPGRKEQTPTQPQQQPPTRQPAQTPAPTKPGDQSWESLKDAMQKLSEIAQEGGTKSPQNDEVTPRVDAPRDRDNASPRTPPKRSSGEERQPRTDPPRADRNSVERSDAERGDVERGDAERGEGDRGDDEAGKHETQPPSLRAFQDLLERYKDTQQNQQPRSDGTHGSEPDDARLPEVRPGMRSPRTANEGSASEPDPSKRVIRRPDRAKPVEPPINSGPRTSDQGEVFPPVKMPSSGNLPSPTGNDDGFDQTTEQQSRNSSGSHSFEESMPSVAEFLKEQLGKGFPNPGTNEDVGNSGSSGTNARPGSTPPRNSGRRDSMQPGTQDAAAGTEQSGIDVRSELQKRGVRGTLDKIIEKAKEESRAQRKAEQQAKQESIAGQPGTVDQPGNTSRQDAQAKSPGDAGLQKSLTDLLGGMDDSVEDVMQNAKFNDRSSESPRSRNSTRQQSPTDSDSRINKWNDAASDFLSDLSKAPSAPASPRSSSGGGGPVSAEAPLAIGSFFLVGLGLLGIVAVTAFLMRRPLLKLVSDATGIASPQRAVRQPGDIRSREDVISAFHELALNPKKLVESWWTHRAAATKLAAESPQQGNAVQTLAEIYEQARYLPDDVELPADKIQSARTALAECR